MRVREYPTSAIPEKRAVLKAARPYRELIERLQDSMPDGLTRTQINRVFNGHRNREELTRMLAHLEETELAHGKETIEGKRKVERWFTGPQKVASND